MYRACCQPVQGKVNHAPPISERCSYIVIEVKPSARAAFASTIPDDPDVKE